MGDGGGLCITGGGPWNGTTWGTGRSALEGSQEARRRPPPHGDPRRRRRIRGRVPGRLISVSRRRQAPRGDTVVTGTHTAPIPHYFPLVLPLSLVLRCFLYSGVSLGRVWGGYRCSYCAERSAGIGRTGVIRRLRRGWYRTR